MKKALKRLEAFVNGWYFKILCAFNLFVIFELQLDQDKLHFLRVLILVHADMSYCNPEHSWDLCNISNYRNMDGAVLPRCAIHLLINPEKLLA